MDGASLGSMPLFAALDEDGLQRWADHLTESSHLAGSGIIREDDFSYRLFLVLDGEVDVLHGFDEVARLGPGDLFGEVGVVTGGRRNARVVARTRCRLASMMLWDFRALAAEHPSVAQEVERLVAARSTPSAPSPAPADPR